MEEVHDTGAVVGERLPAASTTVEETIPISASVSSRGSISAPTQVLESISPLPTQQPPATASPLPTQQPPATASPLPDVAIPGNEPPAYSPTPLPPPSPTPGSPSPSPPSPSPSPSSSSTRSPSPPPPPLPPSPTISPMYTLPATRPASFPLLPTNLNIPSCTPRPYTFHQHPPPAILPPHHSIAIDIFPDPDVSPPPNAEQLPTYSRYPKHGEAHCMGEIGDPDARSEISRLTWDGRSRRQGDGICCCGLYMRTVVTGIVVLIIACVVAGGVVGWQMKANFENVPDSGPQSTPLNGGPGGGNVDDWSPPGDVGNSQPSSTISENVVLERPTATVLVQTMRMPERKPTAR